MKNLSKAVIICVIALIILNIASACYAQDMQRKLLRGAANIISGWVELPKNIYELAAEHDFASGVIMGFPKGCWLAIARTGAGIYDTLTFPFPVPKGYRPLLEPEFIFSDKPSDREDAKKLQ